MIRRDASGSDAASAAELPEVSIFTESSEPILYSATPGIARSLAVPSAPATVPLAPPAIYPAIVRHSSRISSGRFANVQ